MLAAALGAIDLGYRVLVVRDAFFQAAPTIHQEDLLELLSERFSVQLDLVQTEKSQTPLGTRGRVLRFPKSRVPVLLFPMGMSLASI